MIINTIVSSIIIAGVYAPANSISFANIIEKLLYEADTSYILALMIVAIVIITIFCACLYVIVKIIGLFSSKRNQTNSNNNLEEESQLLEEENLSVELENALTRNEKNILLEIDNNDQKLVSNNIPINNEENLTTLINQETKDEEKTKTPLIELDWQKKKKNTSQNSSESINQYMQVRQNISELLKMIVTMLGNNVDELKISQALIFRCKDDVSEETALQLVSSIKEFLDLCNQGAFQNIRKDKSLPSEEKCILHLISGDTSYAMALLEALMDEKINLAVNTNNQLHKNAIFNQTSEYACHFGTLAELNDVNLAMASFELAVEMSPDNPLAWSRCADIYQKMGLNEKANWAYQNVLRTSKNGNNLPQEANAYKHLSQYLYANGKNDEAADLYIQSKHYYDSIGINRPLAKQELELISLMDNENQDNMLEAVLHKQQNTNFL